MINKNNKHFWNFYLVLTPQENKTKRNKKISYSGVREIRTIQPREKKKSAQEWSWYFSATDMQRASYHSAFQRLPTFFNAFCDHPFTKLKPHFNSVPKPLSFSHLTTKRNQIQNLVIPLPLMTHRVPCGGPLPTAEDVGIFATWSLSW